MSDISDLWSIKIRSSQYGELTFSRITEELLSIIDSIESKPENLISCLMENSYNQARNIPIEQIDFSKFTDAEKKDFYIHFLPLQFEGYEIDNDISDFENFEKAVEFWKEKRREAAQLVSESIRQKQLEMSLALSGNSIAQMNRLFDPLRNFQKQMELSMRPFNTLAKTIEEATRIPSLTSYTEGLYPSLSNALQGFNDVYGPLIAKINEPMKTFREQMLETTSALSLHFENYQSAISLIPENYFISTIYRDEDEKYSIYVQDPEDTEEVEYNINNASADEGFIKFLHDIPKKDVIRFVTHLQEYPYLALVDEVGKQIFEAVQTKISDYITIEHNHVFFRARSKTKGAVDWTPLQIGQPQYGIPGMGRYNFLGKPLFYVTTEIETAKLEVESEAEPESTVVKFNQVQDMKVFDISSEDCPLMTYCNMDKQPGNDYTAYLVPNFLSVCCSYLNKKERHSVDAIKYKSNKSENGYCYVILDKAPLDFFDEGEIVDS